MTKVKAGGGLAAHIDRQRWSAELGRMVDWFPRSVRDHARTSLNKEYLAGGMGREAAIAKRISEAGITRGIRSDAVRSLAFLVTSDHETMAAVEREGRLDEFAQVAIDTLAAQFGRENVVAARWHMDETTPHLHITVVPIALGAAKKQAKKGEPEDSPKREYRKQKVKARLCAKELVSRGHLRELQDRFGASFGEAFGLERGKIQSDDDHVDPAIYNKQQRIQQLEDKIADLTERWGEQSAGVQALTEQRDHLTDEIQQLDTEKATKEAHGKTLIEQINTLEGIYEQTRATTRREEELAGMDVGRRMEELRRSDARKDVYHDIIKLYRQDAIKHVHNARVEGRDIVAKVGNQEHRDINRLGKVIENGWLTVLEAAAWTFREFIRGLEDGLKDDRRSSWHR